METTLNEYWRTTFRELSDTAQDLPQLILDCSRLVIEIKEEMNQRHIQQPRAPFSAGPAHGLNRSSAHDSMADLKVPKIAPESGITFSRKRKWDHLEEEGDRRQHGRASCTSGNIPLAENDTPQAYRKDDRSEQQQLSDELAKDPATYHGSISSVFQKPKETRATADRLEFLEKSLSKNISTLADCSSILELVLPQVLIRQLGTSTSTSAATTTSKFAATVGYALTLLIPRVFARPHTKGRGRSRLPPVNLSRVQSEIRAIGQGADEILSAIGRYHSIQCGTKRHREQLDEHHLLHLLSWTREVQARSVALCQLLLQLQPFTFQHLP
ncbi:hypothetical protein EMPS_03952 [Entomortierella parvispora]|uniref:Uncharacterized protein n=1 Tax=Entomortierella parvispora TaxID=205924 RepID=A0A9P3LV31_9FUNG|nr:hypothetical protein EMPS_03952 [Entomortierella parvispora]